MKIVHVFWGLSYGGIETMLVDIVNEQVKSCEVRVFVVNDCYDKDLLAKIDKKVKVTLLGRKSGSKNLWPIIRLNLLLLRSHSDIIHCHDGLLEKLIWIRTPLVRTIHNTHCDPSTFAKYKKLFCISKAVKKYAADNGYFNSRVIYNGIHSEEIISKQIIEECNETVQFVCVGRLHPMKGQYLIVEAFNILVNQKGITNIHVDLIGDGSEREHIERLINRYNLDLYVKLLGAQTRKYIYKNLCKYDAFILPSISEGFGLTLVEACAAKLTIICCDLEGPLEVIDGGKYGRVFHAGNAIDLSESIEDYIKNGNNPIQIESAYNYVKKNFDVKETANKYVEEYKKIIGK